MIDWCIHVLLLLYRMITINNRSMRLICRGNRCIHVLLLIGVASATTDEILCPYAAILVLYVISTRFGRLLKVMCCGTWTILLIHLNSMRREGANNHIINTGAFVYHVKWNSDHKSVIYKSQLESQYFQSDTVTLAVWSVNNYKRLSSAYIRKGYCFSLTFKYFHDFKLWNRLRNELFASSAKIQPSM